MKHPVSALLILVPALVSLFAVGLLVYGWRLIRSDAVEGLDVADLVLLRAEQRTAAGAGGPLERLAQRLVPTLRQLMGPAGMRWLGKQVELAGRPDGASADTVLRWSGMWLILLSPAALVLLLEGAFLPLLLVPAMVTIMPMARLARARRMRRDALDRDLPDFLDILSVTVSAGVGFRSALLRVSERYGGPLAEEMRLTLDQIEHGASRRTAFTALRNRNRSEALSQFVTAFLQSEELGAPLAETLNQIATDMRRSSAQRMRRKAAQTSPRVTLVTSMVLVPGALVLILSGMYLGSGFNVQDIFGG